MKMSKTKCLKAKVCSRRLLQLSLDDDSFIALLRRMSPESKFEELWRCLKCSPLHKRNRHAWVQAGPKRIRPTTREELRLPGSAPFGDQNNDSNVAHLLSQEAHLFHNSMY